MYKNFIRKRGNSMDLKNISTKELVEELTKREAVEKTVVAPYEPCTITVGNQVIYDQGGLIVILRIWD